MISSVEHANKLIENQEDNKWLREVLENFKDQMNEVRKNFVRDKRDGDEEEVIAKEEEEVPIE